MIVRFLPVAFFCLASTFVAGNDMIKLRRGHFFPPPKALYYFRPDLYVYRVGSPFYNFHSRPRFLRSYATPNYTPFRNWIGRAYPYSSYEIPTYSIYRIVVSPPPTGGVVRVNSSDIVFNVTPPNALVFVDDKLIGSAKDFATQRDRYPLLDGDHHLRIEFPGYRAFTTQLQVVPDRSLHLEIQLEREGELPE